MPTYARLTSCTARIPATLIQLAPGTFRPAVTLLRAPRRQQSACFWQRPAQRPAGILRFVASFRTPVLIWSGLSYNNGLCRRIHPYQLIRRGRNVLWEQLRIGILPGLKLSLLLKESHLRLARIQAGFIGGAVNGITFLDFILNS